MQYAIIGLAPYSFHWDISQSLQESYRLLGYYLCLHDLHNYWVSEKYFVQFFNKSYINGGYMKKLSFNLNNVCFFKAPRNIGVNERILTRSRAEYWKNRSYSDTVKENKNILNEYLKLCEINKIRPIIVLPPMTKEYMEFFPKNKLDEFYVILNDVMKKHTSTVFFNGWNIQGLVDGDFYDVDHLNLIGAAKFSAVLNHFIIQLEK